MNAPKGATDSPPGTPVPGRDGVPDPAVAPSCCAPRALFGWSPPALPADTALKRRGAALPPSTRLSPGVFYPAVIPLLDNRPVLPHRTPPVGVPVGRAFPAVRGAV